MIDLHTHTLLSDGALAPAEHIRRAEVRGYRVLGMSDHADLSTMETILGQLLTAARRENELGRMRVLAGIELTHVRPEHMAEAVARARDLGAMYVIVHGETLVEPVIEGTNLAALEAGCDILAHPGLISAEEVKLAARRDIRLEISGKSGHSLANGHVAALAWEHGAKLLFGSDSHEPSQMPDLAQARRICRGAAVSEDRTAKMFDQAEAFATDLLQRAAPA
jgi:histidinol phosphatase-like PHP family hydrolase